MTASSTSLSPSASRIRRLMGLRLSRSKDDIIEADDFFEGESWCVPGSHFSWIGVSECGDGHQYKAASLPATTPRRDWLIRTIAHWLRANRRSCRNVLRPAASYGRFGFCCVSWSHGRSCSQSVDHEG